MAVTFDSALISRLERASKNGSSVAGAILHQINTNPTPMRNKGDYFNSLKSWNSGHTSYTLYVTYCNQDWTRPEVAHILEEHPEPWLMKDYRQKVSLSKFVAMFKDLPHYSDSAIELFISAMTQEGEIEVTVEEGYEGFYEAYCEDFYYEPAPNGSTLHGSCMRYSSRAKQTASFYGDFLKIKIIVARMNGAVIGRALYWDDIDIYHRGPRDLKFDMKSPAFPKVKVLDRVFYTTEAANIAIQNYAAKLGVVIRKNSGSGSDFTAVRTDDEELANAMNCGCGIYWIPTHPGFLELKGYPYLDTFKDMVTVDGCPAMVYRFGTLQSNIWYDNPPLSYIAELRNTDGGCNIQNDVSNYMPIVKGDANLELRLSSTDANGKPVKEWYYHLIAHSKEHQDKSGIYTFDDYCKVLGEILGEDEGVIRSNPRAYFRVPLLSFSEIIHCCDATYYEDDSYDEDSDEDVEMVNMEDEEFDESDYPD